MYTMGELMSIDSGRRERANKCSVELVKTFHELKQESLGEKIKSFFLGHSSVKGYYVIFKLKVVSDTGSTHTVFVRLDPDFNLDRWTENRIQIYCDCADFKFRSAYILNKKGSVFINSKTSLALGSSLTDAPKKTSPTSFLCKHAYAALQWIISNYSSLMRTI